MAKFQRGALVFDRNTEDLTDNKILTVSSAQLQFLDPGEHDRDIFLPQEAQSIGLAFWIINKSSTYLMNVKDDSGSINICSIRPNDVVGFMCDGTIWKADIEPIGNTGGTGATGATGAAGPAGTSARSVITKTTAYDMSDFDDVILADATSGNINIKLPNPANSIKKNRDIKKIDSSVNTVTLIPYNTELIDGGSSKVLEAQYQGMTVITNGINWFLL